MSLILRGCLAVFGLAGVIGKPFIDCETWCWRTNKRSMTALVLVSSFGKIVCILWNLVSSAFISLLIAVSGLDVFFPVLGRDVTSKHRVWAFDAAVCGLEYVPIELAIRLVLAVEARENVMLLIGFHFFEIESRVTSMAFEELSFDVSTEISVLGILGSMLVSACIFVCDRISSLTCAWLFLWIGNGLFSFLG